MSTDADRLISIMTLLDPCPAPDVANGYDMCPIHAKSAWPCNTTKAAWLARRLDERTEVRKAMDSAMQEMATMDEME